MGSRRELPRLESKPSRKVESSARLASAPLNAAENLRGGVLDGEVAGVGWAAEGTGSDERAFGADGDAGEVRVGVVLTGVDRRRWRKSG